MKAEKLFQLEDKWLKLPGLYTVWTILYIANLYVLLSDNTSDNSRNFNVCSNVLSVIYSGVSSYNNIYGNGKPSSMLLMAGPIHQYSHWLFFAYFGGTNVLGTHPIGIMNWVGCIVVGIFTLDMIIKTWVVSIYPKYYTNYANPLPKQSNSRPKVLSMTSLCRTNTIEEEIV